MNITYKPSIVDIPVRVFEDGVLIYCSHGNYYTQLDIHTYMYGGEHHQDEVEITVCGGCDMPETELM